jgi:hypothetical protein
MTWRGITARPYCIVHHVERVHCGLLGGLVTSLWGVTTSFCGVTTSLWGVTTSLWGFNTVLGGVTTLLWGVETILGGDVELVEDVGAGGWSGGGSGARRASGQGLTLVHFQLILSCLCVPRNPT